MIHNHYIYLLYDINNPNRYFSSELNIVGRKIGSTCNIKMRMKPYLTSHPDKVPLECYYQIINYDKFTCYEIDNMLKRFFDEYRLKGNGGIEFYDASIVTQTLIEKYFKDIGINVIKQTIIYDEDQYKLCDEDITDLLYDIKQLEFYKNKIQTYNLLDKYIEKIRQREIINSLTNINYLVLYDKIDNQMIKFLQQNLIDDQIEILLCSILYFESNNNGIWNLFCRYGKTRLSSLFCLVNKYNKILILVPSLYLINQTYSTWKIFFDKSTIKKICCIEDKKTIDDINKFYLNNSTCIFISTYHSSDKFSNLNFDICIYDEAHRTVGNKINQTNNSDISFFKKQLENSNFNTKLFLTATIKEYTGDEDNYYTMDDETIYGSIIASVSALRARELNRICNYKIITIELKSINININIDEFFIKNNITNKKDKENLYAIKDKYLMCAKGLFDTMAKYNIKHVITFHELIINCKFFKTIFEKMCKYYKQTYSIDNIDGTTPNRKDIIDKFQANDYSVLCSAKVLQEGVDISKCDGVIFIDIKTSIIDTIQSLSRCLTIVESEPNKEGHIMIPFDDAVDILNDSYTNNLRLILRNLAEIDNNIKGFFNKIIDINFDNITPTEIASLEELKIKYNIRVNSRIIKELREISYVPYSIAKKLIANKYTHENDYKINILSDLCQVQDNQQLPIDANIIYKKFGWINWDVYLGLESEMSIRKIRSIIQKENINRIKNNLNLIDTKESYQKFVNNNLHLNLLLDIEVENNNWIKFCLINYDDIIRDHYTVEQLKIYLQQYKISNKDQYIEKTKIDNKLIKYEYISNGFYYEHNNGFNINDIYYIEKKNIRRF